MNQKWHWKVSESERNATYESGWEAGSLIGILGAYGDLLFDKSANDTAAEFVRAKIREAVDDPGIAETLSPDDYPFGTKRPCLDTNYYATFNRDNVCLVDLRKTPIVRMTPRGIETSEQEYQFDSIVYATGFDAMTGAITRIDVRGRSGKTLKETWQGGPRTYLGLCMAGFPNLYAITGPGSPSVLSNMMVSIEQHVDWVADCLVYLRDHGYQSIEPTIEAETAWGEHVVEAGNATLYPLAKSWYMGANVKGKTQVFLPYIGGVGPYREKCDDVAANGYEGFILK